MTDKWAVFGGYTQNRAAAWQWFCKAADAGHAKSLNIVGGFFEDGWKVAPAIGIAHDYYRRAAEAGDFRGQFNCARLAAVSRNHAHAADWIAVVPQTATDAFLDKMLNFLRDAPAPGLQRLHGTAWRAVQACGRTTGIPPARSKTAQRETAAGFLPQRYRFTGVVTGASRSSKK